MRHSTPSRLLVALVTALAALACTGAAAAAIDFRAGWEGTATGEDPPAPWEGFEFGGTFDGTPSPAEQLQVVAGPIREGSRAARFVVRPGDRYGASTGERALVRWIGSGEADGQELVYGWSTLFPEDWVAPPGWGILTEWHADSRFPLAPLRFNAGGDSLTLSMTTGECPAPYTCDVMRNYPVLSSLAKGQWNDFVVRVRWRTAPTGRVEVWHRVAGEPAFRQVLDVRDVPTLPWRAGEAPTGIYLLHGLYRGEGQTTTTLLHDGFVRGTSLEEVLASFPDAPPPVEDGDDGEEEPPPAAVDARVVTDPGCAACEASVHGAAVTASVPGGLDDRDSAYAVMPIATSDDPAAPVYVRADIRLPGGPRLAAPVSLLQVRNALGRIVLDLYADASRSLRVWSPAGRMADRALLVSTGESLPADGAERTVEVAAQPGGWLVIAVDGVERARVQGLSGGTTAPVASLRVGILHYDVDEADARLGVRLARVGSARDGWLDGTPIPAADLDRLVPATFAAAVVDPGCGACQVRWLGTTVEATVPGGDDAADSAFALATVPADGWEGPIRLRARIRLAEGAGLPGSVSVLQLRDSAGRGVVDLFLARTGELSVWSPSGGLDAEPVELATGVIVDDTRWHTVVVDARGCGELRVRVDGELRVARDGLTGGDRLPIQTVRAGIEHSDGPVALPASVLVSHVALGELPAACGGA